jgi:large subunit GTPase 1
LELLSTLKNIVLGVRARKLTIQTNKEVNLEIKPEHAIAEKRDENIVTLGMVGYPNVGKSSVINVLCQKKLVGVAAQPGKTKHFQTHFIEKDLLLCDCPGLVFPSASSTRAEMVCNGVLPIDSIKDYISPVDLICQRVEKRVLERLYKIKIELQFPTGSQFLQIFARTRG